MEKTWLIQPVYWNQLNFLKIGMLRLKKSLGQNFLSDKNVIEKIASLDNIKNQTEEEIGFVELPDTPQFIIDSYN